MTTAADRPVTTPAPRRTFLSSPRVILVLLCCAGVLGFASSPLVQIKLGLFTYNHWFLDTYAILAANDAVQLGRDPYLPNTLDFMNRPHSYTHWWLVLGRFGLTRLDNFLVGGCCVLGFLAAFFVTVRPKLKVEAFWYALLLLSPPVQLAIMRGNNDLVVFAVLAIGGLAVARPGLWRIAVAIGSIALATGLKFYPAVAAASLLLVRPSLRLRWTVLLGGVVLVLVGADVWHDLQRAAIPVSINVYSFGGPLLLQDFGLAGTPAKILSVMLLAAGGGWLAWRGQTRGLAQPDTSGPMERHLFAVAAALLVICFVAGISYAYRWIFGLWLAPWLLHQLQAGRDPLAPRLPGGTCTLLTLCMWLDGLFCLVVNLMPGPIPVEVLDQWQVYWRYASQPLNWMLMVLLTGWLLDLVRDAGRAALRPPVAA
jgi:hypothetical protein